MLTSIAGPEYNLGPGDEGDFPDAEAIRLIRAGYADAVTPPIERAVDEKPKSRRKR